MASPPTDKQRDLRANSRPLSGPGKADIAGELERVAALIRDQDIKADNYGSGEYLEAFQAELAELLGFEAARYMPSGCMAQPIALRIWSERKGIKQIAFHATSHLELHEDHGYRELHGLQSILLGDPQRPTLARDLAAVLRGNACSGAPIAALLVELPAREIGGQLPTWTELLELVDLARTAGVALHLDGARLWEAQVAYDRPIGDIASLFDSAYVSFYKGIGALPGAMLFGDEEFCEEASVWQRRQGGTLHNLLPAIVSARTRVTPRRERLARFHERAKQVAALFTKHLPDHVAVLPNPPQTNMFHLVASQGEADEWNARRDRVAAETGIFLTFGWHDSVGTKPGRAWTEMTMSDPSLEFDDAELEHAIQRFFENC